MSLEEWRRLLLSTAASRFVVDGDTGPLELILALGTAECGDVGALRLRRPTGDGARTVLVAKCASLAQVNAALRWSAEVRDCLPEPQPADLSLILDLDDGVARDPNIEAEDRYCRRYVRRVGESATALVQRSALGGVEAATSGAALPVEALAASLATLCEAHGMTGELAAHWRAALLGGQTGGELADRLLSPEDTP